MSSKRGGFWGARLPVLVSFSRTWAAKLTFAGKMTHPTNGICENV